MNLNNMERNKKCKDKIRKDMIYEYKKLGYDVGIGSEFLILAVLNPKNKYFTLINLLNDFGVNYDDYRNYLVNNCVVINNEISHNKITENLNKVSNMYSPYYTLILNNDDKTDDELIDLISQIFLYNFDTIDDSGIVMMDCLGIGGVSEHIIDEIENRLDCKLEILKYNKEEEENKQKMFKDFPMLTNLNEKVKKDDYFVVGMDDEIRLLIRGLMRFKKPNVIIKGKAGTGKTALVEKLADMINRGNVPDFLKDKIILQWDMASNIAGTKYRGEFEEKVMKVLNMLKSNKNYIIFIDEIHTMVDAGGADGAMCMGDILKPSLSRGEIKIIGATTDIEYDKFIAKDTAIQRRFATIDLTEPNKDEVLKILLGAKNSYEKHYDIKLNDDDIDIIIDNSISRNGAYPDKAFDSMEDYILDKLEGQV